MSFQLWELVDGQGVWQKYKNQATGEVSIKEHSLRQVWQGCPSHYFEEEGNSRMVRCKKCGFGTRYVLGLQKLVDGKLVNTKE